MKIKKVKSPDVPRALHKAIFGDEAEWDEGRTSQYWVVYDEAGDPVGFCSLYPLSKEPGCVFFSRAGLLPSAQGKGLHKKMIETRMRWSKRNGYKIAITYTHRLNAKSFSNLQQCGFALYLPENNYAGKEFLYFYADL